MTNYLDTHIEWMQDLGVDVKPIDEVPEITDVPDDLPHETDIWFKYRMPHRVEPMRPLGFQSYDHGWRMSIDDDHRIPSEDPVYPDPWEGITQLMREADKYPYKPVMLGRSDYPQFVVWETTGPRSGWLYYISSEGPEHSEPIVSSLSQWFEAVRTLTALGAYDPTVNDDHSRHAYMPGATVQPPPNTPSWLFYFASGSRPIGDLRGTELLPQLETSITELLPDFEWVHPITPLDELWRDQPGL